LDEKSLIEAEPNLRKGLAGGLLVRNDSVVYQLCATRFFLDNAAESGTKIITGQRVARIFENRLVLEDSTEISAQKIIIAAGFGATSLLNDLKIVKRKGHLVITERCPNFVRHQLVELGYLRSAHSTDTDSVAFNVQPRITEQILIGSSRQFGAVDGNVDLKILSRMIKRAAEFMPDLSKLQAIRVWTGFRPATPDNLPYIGRHPKFQNIFLAAGHEGLGITTSLGTAELICDEILERPSEISRKPFSPERFEMI
jgi:glycine/D-amino acid oxidase-like deaminating enzyme